MSHEVTTNLQNQSVAQEKMNVNQSNETCHIDSSGLSDSGQTSVKSEAHQGLMDPLDSSSSVSESLSPQKRSLSDAGSKEDGANCRKKRNKDQRICKVCGDKALGYNFNAMTCESCKAFFRRNALKETTPPCLFQSNCVIDMRTRRFCPYCRLDKCYSVGMKRDMILDDGERKARMQKVMQNRQRKGRPTGLLDKVKEEPVDMLPDQSDSGKCVSPSIPSVPESLSVLEQILPKHADSAEKCLKAPPVLDSKVREKDPEQYRIISPAEYLLFEGLSNAYSATLAGESVDHKNIDQNSYRNCNDLINNSEFAVRRLIKFIKQLEDFQQLTQEDQLGLLKSCVLSSIMLRSCWFYNIERNSWRTSSGEISTTILSNSTGYTELYELHTQFCRTVKELFGEDKTMFSLMQVICVFNPDCKDTRAKSTISNIQDKYLILLKHYLEWEHSYINSHVIFAKVMKILAEMRNVNDAHNTIILQANPTEIEPLMLEVLDLK